jgi:hypothetical protein
MSSIDTRIERLEEQIGVSPDGRCHCSGGGFETRSYFVKDDQEGLSGTASHDAADADTRLPDPCQKCGGWRKLVKFIFADHESVAAGR